MKARACNGTGKEASRCSSLPDVRGPENLPQYVQSVESCESSGCVLGPAGRRSPGPLVLFADTQAWSSSVCQPTPTRGSPVLSLSLTSGDLLKSSNSKSLKSPFEFFLIKNLPS